MDWHEVEARRQSVVRMNNELAHTRARPTNHTLVQYACECGDANCASTVIITNDEYEAVRAHSARFLIVIDHENPETDMVVAETTSFAVIEKMPGPDEHAARSSDPRRSS